MVSKTDTRIAKRTSDAEKNLATRGLMGLMVGGAGLRLANFVDRLTGWTDDERVVFTAGTAKGLIRGGTLGIVLGVVALASFPVSLAAIAGTVLLGSAAAGAAGFGIYEGQKSLDRYHYGQRTRLADAIAQKTGAVKKPQPTVKSGAELTEEEEKKSSFADRVKSSQKQSGGRMR